jgi:hypothetical protein
LLSFKLFSFPCLALPDPPPPAACTEIRLLKSLEGEIAFHLQIGILEVWGAPTRRRGCVASDRSQTSLTPGELSLSLLLICHRISLSSFFPLPLPLIDYNLQIGFQSFLFKFQSRISLKSLIDIPASSEQCCPLCARAPLLTGKD